MAPGIEAVLHFSLVIDVIEGTVTERDDNDNSDDRRDIGTAARLRLVVVLVR